MSRKKPQKSAAKAARTPDEIAEPAFKREHSKGPTAEDALWQAHLIDQQSQQLQPVQAVVTTEEQQPQVVQAVVTQPEQPPVVQAVVTFVQPMAEHPEAVLGSLSPDDMPTPGTARLIIKDLGCNFDPMVPAKSMEEAEETIRAASHCDRMGLSYAHMEVALCARVAEYMQKRKKTVSKEQYEADCARLGKSDEWLRLGRLFHFIAPPERLLYRFREAVPVARRKKVEWLKEHPDEAKHTPGPKVKDEDEDEADNKDEPNEAEADNNKDDAEPDNKDEADNEADNKDEAEADRHAQAEAERLRERRERERKRAEKVEAERLRREKEEAEWQEQSQREEALLEEAGLLVPTQDGALPDHPYDEAEEVCGERYEVMDFLRHALAVLHIAAAGGATRDDLLRHLAKVIGILDDRDLPTVGSAKSRHDAVDVLDSFIQRYFSTKRNTLDEVKRARLIVGYARSSASSEDGGQQLRENREETLKELAAMREDLRAIEEQYLVEPEAEDEAKPAKKSSSLDTVWDQ
jgi:hypothetical protein